MEKRRDHRTGTKGAEECADVIRSDADALAVARKLAAKFAPGAADRDAGRILPYAELATLGRSGLWALTVPRAYGGPQVSAVTLAEVTVTLAAADASIGQIPQNHFYMAEVVRFNGTEEQKRFFFGELLQGKSFGNALSETGTRTVAEYRTRLYRTPDGYRLTGQKFYSTGALFADWIPVVARNDGDYLVAAFVPKQAKGLTVIDDWSSFGQRTTGSGTTRLDDVAVEPDRVFPYQRSFDLPSPLGPIGQLLHAAVDLGIAQAALQDTLDFVRTRTRPWIDSKVDRAAEDPLLIAQVGRLEAEFHAAEALLARAGRYVDQAVETPTAHAVAEASVAVAEAKAITTEVSLEITNRLFECAGTQATLSRHRLDRHWRNARTHTLHDPVRWKYHAIGNYHLNGIAPPRHGAL